MQREKLPYLYNDDDDEHENLDDQPTVVVLNPGDLNAEEVEAEKKKEKAGILVRLRFVNTRILQFLDLQLSMFQRNVDLSHLIVT